MILGSILVNKIKVSEGQTVLGGILLQTGAIVFLLIFYNFLPALFGSAVILQLGITVYNIPMTSKIVGSIEKEYISRTLGVLTLVSDATFPLSSLLVSFLLAQFPLVYTIGFFLAILCLSLPFYARVRRAILL